MNYVAMKDRVNKVINRVSNLSISTTKTTSDDYTQRYDPVSDSYKWYNSSDEEVSAPTSTTYTGTCVEILANDYLKASGYMKETDKMFLVSDFPKPQKNDVVTVGGVDYTVYRVETVSPGGTDLLYRIYVRI